MMVDPFTGGSSYQTAQFQQQAQQQSNVVFKPPTSSTTSNKKHFPHSKYMSFDNCDPVKVHDKIKEFNNKLSDASLKVTDTNLENVIKFALPVS